VGEAFQAFWDAYKCSHPSHVVFTRHATNLSQVVPLLIHGDEGRSIKKTAYLILSMESPIGILPHRGPACDCSAVLAARPDLPTYGVPNHKLLDAKSLEICRGMTTNFKGHSYLSRFLLFGLGGWVYKKNPHVTAVLFERVAEDFRLLLEEGVGVGNRVYYGAVIGTKGDMEFHQKYFGLLRSYSNVQTRAGSGSLCHQCMASTGQDSQFPFEDLRERPHWEATMYSSRPWGNPEPALAGIPYDPQTPERTLKADVFHVVKLGRARWQRISKRLQGEKEKLQSAPSAKDEPSKAKAKAKASAAARCGKLGQGSEGKVTRSASITAQDRSSSEVPQAAQIGAYVGPEHAVSVSLEAAAPDLLEVEFSKVLFSVQGTSYLPPAIDFPPGDTARRKFFAVAERVVPLPDGASEAFPQGEGSFALQVTFDLSLPS
ncbi:unnamed protein product, partial [Symbiodinium necroappetens]